MQCWDMFISNRYIFLNVNIEVKFPENFRSVPFLHASVSPNRITFDHFRLRSLFVGNGRVDVPIAFRQSDHLRPFPSTFALRPEMAELMFRLPFRFRYSRAFSSKMLARSETFEYQKENGCVQLGRGACVLMA